MSNTTRKTFNSTQLVRYVDPSGSNSFDGLSPQKAFATIQAAYNDLKTVAEANLTDAGKGLGVGRIYLMPGLHDVGAGLSFVSNRPVEILGTRSGSVVHFPSNSSSKIISSSASATEFVKISHATAIGYGFVFRDIYFQMDSTVNTSLTKVIYAVKVGNLVVDHCSFDNADNSTNTSVTAVYHEDVNTSAGEGGWVRVTNNNCSRLQLYQSATTGLTPGGNFNRGRIRDNVIFYGGSLPMIHLNSNANGYLIDGNNIEGTATGIKLSNGAFTQCTFINNSGEDPTVGSLPNPVYDISNASQMVIIGGTVSSIGATSPGVFATFDSTSNNNLVIGPFDKTGSTADKRMIVDNSTLGVRILDTSGGYYSRYKSAAGATISDSDFAKTPDNGAWGIAHDSTSNQDKFYYRANGVWRFVDFNYLLTTKGDILGFGTAAARLPVGGDGQVLTADSTQTLGIKWGPAGGASSETIVSRTSDSTAITANTTLANDSILKFPIGSSATEVWFFDALLLISAANATMDLKVGISLPAAATASWGNGDVAGASANPGFYSLATGSTPTGPLGGGGVVTLGSAGQQLMVRVSGWVFGGGTAGNVNLQFAQNTSDAGNLVIKKGAHLKYYQLTT